MMFKVTHPRRQIRPARSRSEEQLQLFSGCCRCRCCRRVVVVDVVIVHCTPLMSKISFVPHNPTDEHRHTPLGFSNITQTNAKSYQTSHSGAAFTCQEAAINVLEGDNSVCLVFSYSFDTFVKERQFNY